MSRTTDSLHNRRLLSRAGKERHKARGARRGGEKNNRLSLVYCSCSSDRSSGDRKTLISQFIPRDTNARNSLQITNMETVTGD